MYIPPFEISAETINMVAEISAQVERFVIRMEQEDGLRLRKANRVKTIHSSLAIEGNTLSEDEVSDIIDGKTVIAPIKQIQEVKNAIATYELYPTLDAFKEKDLLKAHGVMMKALIDDAGRYRSCGVGVFGQQGLAHLAPPAERVPALMSELMEWLKKSKDHLLIRSCVFHYEFEFIHPFIDGNGRMGRYWQTMLLSKWKALFAWIPVETIIKANQKEYYNAIAISDKQGKSTEFIAFMLRCLYDSLKQYQMEKVADKVTYKVADKKLNPTEEKILKLIDSNPYMTINDICVNLKMSDSGVRKNLAALRAKCVIKRIGANKNGHWEIIK